MPSSRTLHAGPISSRTKETDGELRIAGVDFTAFPVTNITYANQRIAANNYSLRITNAVANATAIIGIDIASYFMKKVGTDPNWDAIFGTAQTPPTDMAHDIRGLRIKSINVAYIVAGNALTGAPTLGLQTATHANNVATALTNRPVTGALPTAVQANPYVTLVTVTTPYVIGINTALTTDTIDLQIPMTTTTTFDFLGVWLNLDYNLL